MFDYTLCGPGSQSCTKPDTRAQNQLPTALSVFFLPNYFLYSPFFLGQDLWLLFSTKENEGRYILKNMGTLPTLVTFQQTMVSLCLDTCVWGCWQQSLGPTEVDLGLTECYKIMPLHYFHLLVQILRHTENKANQFPKTSEDRPHVCHPTHTALSPLKIK